ncbi:MAG: FtsX-like permease family protein [Actinobacteria bacterium]|nr:FtsX-like permease family protein [Actinomycetota bacterium]
MNLPLLELRRQPSRFIVATVVLSFLATLLMFLGGLLDGLYLGSTGAIRAQQADVIVYSESARDSFLRSRITSEQRAQVEAAEGVEEVGGIGFVLLGAQVPGETDIANVAVAGYETPPKGVPAPPPDGQGIADTRLEDAGASTGDVILVGPQQTPIEIIGFVDDTSYLQQSSVWVNLPTWRAVQNANRPDSTVSDDIVQALVVSGTGDLVTSIDTATAGATSTLTKDDAVLALPGVKQQGDTFNQIIYSTLVVVLAVVGLFFSLLTLERLGLYGVLKAIGASTRRLFAGVVLQAVIVAVVAFVIGSLLAIGAAAALPAAVPLQLTPARFLSTFIGLVVAAVLGSAVSLRKVTKVDPASAIGNAS